MQQRDIAPLPAPKKLVLPSQLAAGLGNPQSHKVSDLDYDSGKALPSGHNANAGPSRLTPSCKNPLKPEAPAQMRADRKGAGTGQPKTGTRTLPPNSVQPHHCTTSSQITSTTSQTRRPNIPEQRSAGTAKSSAQPQPQVSGSQKEIVAFQDVNDDSDNYLPSDDPNVHGKRKRRNVAIPPPKKAKVAMQVTPGDAASPMEVDSENDELPDPGANIADAGDDPDSKKNREIPIATRYIYTEACKRCKQKKLVCRVQYKSGKRGGGVGACYACSIKRVKCEEKGNEKLVQDVIAAEHILGDIMAEEAKPEVKPPRRVYRKRKEETGQPGKFSLTILFHVSIRTIAEDTQPSPQMPSPTNNVAAPNQPLGKLLSGVGQTSPNAASAVDPTLDGEPKHSLASTLSSFSAAAQQQFLDDFSSLFAEPLAERVSALAWKYLEPKIDAKLDEFTVILDDIRNALNKASVPPTFTLTPATPFSSQENSAPVVPQIRRLSSIESNDDLLDKPKDNDLAEERLRNVRPP